MPGGPRSSKSKTRRLPTQIVRGCIGGLFAKDFDSQFDSHGLGQRRMELYRGGNRNPRFS